MQGPAICPQLCGPGGRAFTSFPDRPGCAAERAQVLSLRLTWDRQELCRRSLRSAGWLLAGGPVLSASPSVWTWGPYIWDGFFFSFT